MKTEQCAGAGRKDHTPSNKRGRPYKDFAKVQRSIQLGSPEALAKKILSTPPGKVKKR